MPAYPKKREAICVVCGHYKKGLKQDIRSGEGLSSVKKSREIAKVVIDDIVKGKGEEIIIKAKEFVQKKLEKEA